jgi:hypothetical protein
MPLKKSVFESKCDFARTPLPEVGSETDATRFCRVKEVVTKGSAVVGNLIRKPSWRTELLRTWVDH